MTLYVHLVGETPIRIWGLSARERVRRLTGLLTDARFVDDLDDIPADAWTMLLHAGYVTDLATLQKFSLYNNAVLRSPTDQRFAAAIVPGVDAAATASLLGMAPESIPINLQPLEPAQLDAYDGRLRRAGAPLLEPIDANKQRRIENRLYGSSYKGITDLVTKFVWPRPARHGVRACAALGITPNMVTLCGLFLMVLAAVLFHQGHFFAGLVAGWFMTFLDTVDGKLARVTVQPSRIGHILDHGMDIIHPPFWYVLWGSSLPATVTLFGLTKTGVCWLIFAGYVTGRVAELVFESLGKCEMFAWRPFDAYFRLITARRNTCLIILTLAVLVDRPAWGFLGVAVWTLVTSSVLVLRLLYAGFVRVRSGPLESWLSDYERAERNHAKAFATFSRTEPAGATD